MPGLLGAYEAMMTGLMAVQGVAPATAAAAAAALLCRAFNDGFMALLGLGVAFGLDRSRMPPGAEPPHSGPSFSWSLLRLGWARGGHAFGVLSIWLLVERVTGWWQRIRPVGTNSVFRYALARHRGPSVRLRDGCVVLSGDMIVELHFDNRTVARISGATPNPWPLVQAFRADLHALHGLQAEGKLGDPKALHGVTLFALAGPRVGFEFQPLPDSWRARLDRFFMAGLVALYTRTLEGRGSHGDRWPGEIWMSREAFDRGFGGELKVGHRAGSRPPDPAARP